MIKKVFKVIIQLYASIVTRSGTWTGRVVPTGSLKIDDVITLAVSRRTDLNPATLKAGYIMLRDVVLEQILEGKYVEFGLSHYGLLVGGVFEGDHPAWDSGLHSLYLRATTPTDVRMALKSVDKEICGAANTGIAVNTLLDRESGKTNSRITPGGGVILEGFKMKIEGDAEGVGLFLKNTGTGQVIQIPKTSIMTNEPVTVSFIVPAALPEGEYQLIIVSQYSSGRGQLKTPRTYVFGHLLTCGADKVEVGKEEPEIKKEELEVGKEELEVKK